MQDKFDNISISLAGILQAVSLARDLAMTGTVNETAYLASINSIFQTHPENMTAVYGSIAEIQLGLKNLIKTLNPISDFSQLNLRYLFSLMSVQTKIFRSNKTTSILSQRLEQAKKQVDYFAASTHPSVIANLADIYMGAISDYRFRFYISGNKKYLSSEQNMEKIRALLLAALRATVLWRQSGGSRTQLIFARKKIQSAASKLLNTL